MIDTWGRTATIVVMEQGVLKDIFGTPTAGDYWVQEFVNGEPTGGAFFETETEAMAYIAKYESSDDDRYGPGQCYGLDTEDAEDDEDF